MIIKCPLRLHRDEPSFARSSGEEHDVSLPSIRGHTFTPNGEEGNETSSISFLVSLMTKGCRRSDGRG